MNDWTSENLDKVADEYERPTPRSLDDFLRELKANPPTGEFKPCAFWNADGGMLEVYLRPENYRSERVSPGISILWSLEEEGAVVGVMVHGVKKLIGGDNDGR